MPSEPLHPANSKIIIKEVDDTTLTLSVNGEVQKIGNQLAELKSLLEKHQTQRVQNAGKVYNIGSINHANFGVFTGREKFNETLTKQLVEVLGVHHDTIKRIALQKDWDAQASNVSKVQEFLAKTFVGMIGIQLRKLTAIGKEEFTEETQKKYIQKCINIARRSLDLVGFVLLSALWDASKKQPFQLTDTERLALEKVLKGELAPSIDAQFQFVAAQVTALGRFSANSLPITELNDIKQFLLEGSELEQVCHKMQELETRLEKGTYHMLDCYEAEHLLATFFKYFFFLIHYRMVSIKHIGYLQGRNADARYIHSYSPLGPEGKTTEVSEKINYTDKTVCTDTVLLYRGDNYQDNVNLFPFIIDFNALTLESGAKICSYRSRETGNEKKLEFLFLEDDTTLYIEKRGVLRPETNFNEFLLHKDNRKTMNLDMVVDQFVEACESILKAPSSVFDEL